VRQGLLVQRLQLLVQPRQTQRLQVQQYLLLWFQELLAHVFVRLQPHLRGYFRHFQLIWAHFQQVLLQEARQQLLALCR
jgi:hypothetical protein